METRATNAAPHVAIAPARLDQAEVRGTVRTNLAPPVAVAAQAGAEQSRFNRGKRPETPEKSTQSSFSTDRETGELVFRVLDSSSHTVLSQYPYESILKLRAYIDASEDKSGR